MKSASFTDIESDKVMKKNRNSNLLYSSGSSSTFKANPRRRRRQNKKIFWIVISFLIIGLIGFGLYEWQQYKASASYRTSGIEYFNANNYNQAEKEFEHALETGGVFAQNLHRDIRYYLAETLFSQGKYQAALDLYQVLEKKEENAAANYCFQGACYAKLGNTTAAQEQFNKALEQDNQESLHYLSKLYYDLEDYDKAVEYEERYIKFHDDKGYSYIILAKGYIEQKEYKKAGKALAAGLALENTADVQQQLEFQQVVLFEKQLDFDKAYEKCRAYVAKYPQDTAAKLELQFLESR